MIDGCSLPDGGETDEQTPIAETELALNSTDFLIAPTWVIGGVLLWRRVAIAYVISLGLLFQASMLFIGLIIIMLLQPAVGEAPFSLVDVAVVFAMGMICFIPFGLFARRVMSSPKI